ncbi:MAG: hypothetical protein AAB870_01700, partial [Patescibacteria group bacterium]
MLTANKPIEIKNDFFTTVSPLLITFGDGKLPEMHKDILRQTHTLFGQAVATILAAVQAGLELGETESILMLPLHPDRELEDAHKLIKKEKGNSYNLFKVEEREGRYWLYFRLAAMKAKGEKEVMAATVNATIMQGLLRNWLRNAPKELPRSMRDGAYQKAAEQLLSFIELWYTGDAAGQKPSYPDTAERCPTLRKEARVHALHAVTALSSGLQYAKRRDVTPGKFKDDDLAGDRLVCITPEWIEFVRSPNPKRLPVFFTNGTSGSPVQLFKRSTNGRIYAFLPLLTATVGVLMPRPGQKTDWWYPRKDKFVALDCSNPKWPESGTGIMLPLGLDSTPHKSNPHKGWMEHYLTVSGGIGTISIKEFKSPHPNRKGKSGLKLHKQGDGKREWKLDIALRLTTMVSLQP